MLTNLFVLAFVIYCSAFIWWIKRQQINAPLITDKTLRVASLLIISLILLQWFSVHHFIIKLTSFFSFKNLPLLLTVTLSYIIIQLIWRMHLGFSQKSLPLIVNNPKNIPALQLFISTFFLIQFCLASLMQPLLMEYGIIISLIIISIIYAIVWVPLIRGYQLIITIFWLSLFNVFTLIEINVLPILVGEALATLLFLPMSKRRKFLL